MVRFFLQLDEVDDLLGSTIQKFVKKLAAPYNNSSLLSRTLKSLKSLEDELTNLQEKENRSIVLGQLESKDFIDTFKLRRDFCLKEHDNLSQILCSTIAKGHIDYSKDVQSLFTQLQNVDSYNTILIHYIPAVVQLSLRLDPNLSTNPVSISVKDMITYGSSLRDKKLWKLDYWRGAIQVIYYTFAAGLYTVKSYEGDSVKDIDHEKDILDALKEGIDAGGYELLLFISSEVNPSQILYEPFFDFRSQLRFYVPELKVIGDMSQTFTEVVISSLEKVVEAVIINTADILKTMRLNEEDLFLANAHNDSFREGEDPGLDLERFFIFVSCLFHGRPDSAKEFWSDPEGDLYGFLTWASQCEILFMSAAYCNMLASLSTGPVSALASHKFLALTDSPSTLQQKSRKSSLANYTNMFRLIKDAITKLKPPQPTQNSLFAKPVKMVSNNPELDQFDILLLTNFLNLISQVVTYSSEAREELLDHEEIKLVSTLFDFLSFYTPLYGPILNVCAGLSLTTTLKTKTQIWFSLDAWLFNSNISFPLNENRFESYSDILGFAQLVESLLRDPIESSELYSLPYPENLGDKYRTPGIWPYVDFMINNVFYTVSTNASLTPQRILGLQNICLKFIRHCLRMMDYEAIALAPSIGINPDAVVANKSLLGYLLKHPSTPAMNFLFDSKIYNTLIGLTSVDVDSLPSQDDALITSNVIDTLMIINRVLELQNTYIDVVVKSGNKIGDFNISTHGIYSFEDAILYNISFASYLGLFVGSRNMEVASLALKLFDKISLSTQFNIPTNSSIDTRIKGNRLLTILESSEDSTRIREGFIEQIEQSSHIYEEEEASKALLLKKDILKLIIKNLLKRPREPSVSHFLLGFSINSDGTLALDSSRCGIASDISLLKSFMEVLKGGMEYISPVEVPKSATAILSKCTYVIQLLLQSPGTSFLVLDYFRGSEFLLGLAKSEPIISTSAIWDGVPFEDTENFFGSEAGIAFESFLKHRTGLMNSVAIEVHTAANRGTISLVSKYTDALINDHVIETTPNSSGTRVMQYLDILEFEIPIPQADTSDVAQVFGQQVVTHYFDNQDNLGFKESLKELKLSLKLKGLEFIAGNKISSLSDSEYADSVQYVTKNFTQLNSQRTLRTAQLEYLKAWTKLVLILINDAELRPDARSRLLLAIIKQLIPKLTYYAVGDVEFAKMIASLLVTLYNLYQQDMDKIKSSDHIKLDSRRDGESTHSFFRSTVAALRAPTTTPDLRSELYILAFRYLSTVLKAGSSLVYSDCMEIIQSSGDKLIGNMCQDALNGDSKRRSTALVLLKVISRLSVKTNSNFLLSVLLRYNLLLLLVQQLFQYDAVITSSSSPRNTEFYYTYLSFKSTLGFLQQLARTNDGAYEVIQCGLFQYLQTTTLLRSDPDAASIVPDESFYEILGLVFQLLIIVVMSMGVHNDPVLARVRAFLQEHEILIAAVVRKEVLKEDRTNEKLSAVVKQIVLLVSLASSE